MLNDSDLQKAAEDMLNNDAHDEVRKIISLFSSCFLFFPGNIIYCMLINSIYHWFSQVLLSFTIFTTSLVAGCTPNVKFQEEVHVKMVFVLSNADCLVFHANCNKNLRKVHSHQRSI